ncbi:MAG: stage VI sporulation protein F [Bacilli bacterium]|nr:stage VI sporulation protein F [Bacilli bacterium]
MNNDVFSKVESKTKVKKEDIFSLARSIQNKDLKDENELRKIIKDVAKLAGKEVSKEKEEKIIDAIIKDKIPRNLDKQI